MTRRHVRGGVSRGLSRPMIPSPSSSALSTPLSSAYPSTYASEIETEDEVNKINISSLTLDVPVTPMRRARRTPRTPFHFLSLPSELRLKIYDYYFDEDEKVIDLCPENYRKIHKRLVLIKVCRQLHDEATHYFYTTRRFRIFPTYPGRYFKTKKPLLSRMKPQQREKVSSLELRLGPGWNAPPRGWIVNDALGLKQCTSCHKLVVFVECDPSDGIFKGFRRSEGFYEAFCRRLLTAVLEDLPAVKIIEFDAWSSVKKSGAMMRTLLSVASQSGKLLRWGPERGWTDDMEEDDDDIMQAPGESSDVMVFDGAPIAGYPTQNIVAVA